VKKALSLGARSPLVATFGSKQYQQANLVTLLAALEATYVVNIERSLFFSDKVLILILLSSHYNFEKVMLNVAQKSID